MSDYTLQDFGPVAHLDRPCTPRELFCRLQNVEENVHYVEPAYRFARAALGHADVVGAKLSQGGAATFVDRLFESGRTSPPTLLPERFATSWPLRVVHEFAPVGLTDGAWLQGLVRLHVVETRAGMKALAQLMRRFGGPGAGESYAERYAALLRSVGVPPAAVVRCDLAETGACAEISFEHALLGSCLSLFPSVFEAETVGFNLWMAALGPCPLLDHLEQQLRSEGASLAYFQMHDREWMATRARETCEALLEERGDDATRARIHAGFAAAERSYRRWESAMLGRNVPLTPREFVLETIGAKARFALGHHGALSIGGRALEGFLRGDTRAHEDLLDHLANSEWIAPGDPARSRLLNESMSFGGAMFDVFTPAEKRDWREWVSGLGDSPRPPSRKSPVPLEGAYAPPHDPDALTAHVTTEYSALTMAELLYRLINADRYPGSRLFGRRLVATGVATIRSALSDLEGDPPPYSEQLLAGLIERNHRANVRGRPKEVHVRRPGKKPLIGVFLDGVWLQGFADVSKIHLEEYGWLFRIYASELGDGNLEWNHNYIARKRLEHEGTPEAHRLTDRALYESDAYDIQLSDLLIVAVSLNPRRFLAELLGFNLGMEAKYVGGAYVTNSRRSDNPWAALYNRLHNSIDNYATGHTRWSAAALAAWMARVAEAVPGAASEQWARAWSLWRVQEVLEHGTPEQRRVLDGLGLTGGALTLTSA